MRLPLPVRSSATSTRHPAASTSVGGCRAVVRLATAALLGAVLAGCAAPAGAPSAVPPSPPSAVPAADAVPLRIIGFNDFHGHLEPGSLSLTLANPAAPAQPLRVPVGGAAGLAGTVARLRADAPHSLVVAAGDLVGAAPLVSTLFRHESTIEVMNRLGLDLNAAGNHEFDAGLTELVRLYRGGCAAPTPQAAVSSCALENPYRGARFPLLAANVVDERTGEPALTPWVIRPFDGIPVGVIGVVTRTTPSIVVPSGVAGLRFIDEAEAINRAAAQLRQRGVKAIVAVLHEGGVVGPAARRADWNDSRCTGRDGPIFDIVARTTRDVDVFFTGHTHQGYRCEVDGRVVIQATSYGRGVSVVDLVLDRRTGDVDPARTRSINLPVLNDRTDREPGLRERVAAATPEPYAAVLRTARPDAAIAARVAEIAAIVAPKAGQPVGRIAGRFSRNAGPTGPGDSAAGRLIADAQLAATRAPERGGAQLAFMNPGGIRSDLECAAPPCTVSFGAAFGMQPFGNSLVVMTLSGAQIKALLESQARPGGLEPMFLQPSAGFTYRWNARASAGHHVEDMRLHGAPLEPAARVRVTVNSFLAEGGDGFVTLQQGSDRLGGVQDLDALIAHLQTEPPLAPVAQPRVTWVP